MFKTIVGWLKKEKKPSAPPRTQNVGRTTAVVKLKNPLDGEIEFELTWTGYWYDHEFGSACSSEYMFERWIEQCQHGLVYIADGLLVPVSDISRVNVTHYEHRIPGRL